MRKNILNFTKKFLLCFITLTIMLNFSACSLSGNNTSNNKPNSEISNNNNNNSGNNNSNSNNNNSDTDENNSNNNNNGNKNEPENNTQNNTNPYDNSANYTLTFANDFPLQLQENVYHANGVLLRNNKIELTKVDYKIVSYTYSNYVSISFSVIAKKTYASGYMNNKSVDVDYKIYDEDGVVIKSRYISISSDIGETVKKDVNVYLYYDTSPKPDSYNYTIEFSM